jgi:N-acetylmuramoyl-L-alanine amidase
MSNGKKEVYLIAGHSSGDPGAIGVNSRKEADETIKVRNAVKKLLTDAGVSVIIDNDRKRLADVLKDIVSGEEDIVCDIHFNASENAKATGIEVLIPGRHTNKERSLALLIAMGIRKATNLALRSGGVKTELESHRGSLGIMRELGTNVLIELCFISNENDMKAYDTNFDQVVQNIASAIISVYKQS